MAYVSELKTGRKVPALEFGSFFLLYNDFVDVSECFFLITFNNDKCGNNCTWCYHHYHSSVHKKLIKYLTSIIRVRKGLGSSADFISFHQYKKKKRKRKRSSWRWRGGSECEENAYLSEILCCTVGFFFKEVEALHPITVLQWAACDFGLAGE